MGVGVDGVKGETGYGYGWLRMFPGFFEYQFFPREKVQNIRNHP